MCNNECISEGICKHNEECYDDLCFTSEQLKVVDKWLAKNRNKTIDEIGMKLCAEIYFGYEVEERVWEVLEQLKEKNNG